MPLKPAREDAERDKLEIDAKAQSKKALAEYVAIRDLVHRPLISQLLDLLRTEYGRDVEIELEGYGQPGDRSISLITKEKGVVDQHYGVRVRTYTWQSDRKRLILEVLIYIYILKGKAKSPPLAAERGFYYQPTLSIEELYTKVDPEAFNVG